MAKEIFFFRFLLIEQLSISIIHLFRFRLKSILLNSKSKCPCPFVEIPFRHHIHAHIHTQTKNLHVHIGKFFKMINWIYDIFFSISFHFVFHLFCFLPSKIAIHLNAHATMFTIQKFKFVHFIGVNFIDNNTTDIDNLSFRRQKKNKEK